MMIGDREIGPQADVYIIAELGVNHDGSVERALELTDAAADAGADAVKLQLFSTDLLMSRAAKLAAYQKAAGETDPIAMLRRLELPIREMARVVDRAHERGLHAIVTVFSVELVAEAQILAWDAYKTASPDMVHRPLLDALAATGKPMIVSTGASTLEEFYRTFMVWLLPIHDRLAALQCVSSYPTATQDAEIAAMRPLQWHFKGPVGYSDHTAEIDTGAVAASGTETMRGADILEKHLTYSTMAPGPDHQASLEPESLRRYCGAARAARVERWFRNRGDVRFGSGDKRVLACEQDVRTVSRQSIVTRGPLRADQRIRSEDLTFKRPGTGIEPWRIEEVVGRQTRRAIEADVPLTDADLV